MAITVKVEGLRELEAAMKDLTKAAGRGVLRRSLKKAAEPMAALARSLAPVDKGHMRDSIHVGTKLASGDAGKAAFAKVMHGGGSRADAVSALRDARRGQSSVSMYVGPGQHPQAITQEFGTVNHGPQPFMRPAWDQDHKALLDRLSGIMRVEIDKAIARAERKAAQLAVRG